MMQIINIENNYTRRGLLICVCILSAPFFIIALIFDLVVDNTLAIKAATTEVFLSLISNIKCLTDKIKRAW